MASMEWIVYGIGIVAILALLIAVGVSIWATIQTKRVNEIQWSLSRQVGYVNRRVNYTLTERGPRGRRGEIGDTGFAGPPGTPGRDALPSWAIITQINTPLTLPPINSSETDIIDFTGASIMITGSGMTYVPLENLFLCNTPGSFLFTWCMNPTQLLQRTVYTGIVLNGANPPPPTSAVVQLPRSDQLFGQACVTMSQGDTAQLFIENVDSVPFIPMFGNSITIAISLNAQRIPGPSPI